MKSMLRSISNEEKTIVMSFFSFFFKSSVFIKLNLTNLIKKYQTKDNKMKCKIKTRIMLFRHPERVCCILYKQDYKCVHKRL